MNKTKEIAKDYVESLGEILPGFRYGLGNFKEYTFKYYYDFVFLTLDGQIPHEPPIAGGACGFTIDKKTNEIETLSFGELGELDSYDRELNLIYAKIKDLKDNNASLNWLKSKYNLNSSELLRIKKAIGSTTFEKDTIIEELNDLIFKNK